jgi:hypothetical protein
VCAAFAVVVMARTKMEHTMPMQTQQPCPPWWYRCCCGQWWLWRRRQWDLLVGEVELVEKTDFYSKVLLLLLWVE